MGAFPHYPTRDVRNLDGAWDFAWLGDTTRIEDVDPMRLSFDTVMAVPGVLDALPRYAGQRGIGVYRTIVPVETAAGERLRLVCGGMGLYGRIWWDGQVVGDYDLPYSGLDYDFTTAAGGDRHELVIALDNRFDQEKVPIFRPFYDFYGYGGIYRSIELQRLPALRLERVQVTTLDLASGRVRLHFRFGGEAPAELAVTVAFDAGAGQSYRLTPTAAAATLEVTVPDFRVWSPASPHLHTVTVALAGDTVVERFGLRTVSAVGQEIRLNGKAVRLCGVNRHEAHPQFGPALPIQVMVEDLQHLRDLGANFVRCVHYPQDPQFLDLCDQAGLLVWHESMGWGNDVREVTHPSFCAAQVRQTRAMVRNSLNHPSIILWGFLNEFASDNEAARPLCRTLVETIRQEDNSRLVTYASCRNEKDLCFDLVDVVAMNTYPGWIGELDWNVHAVTRVASGVKRLADFASQPPLCEKPCIMAEIGACGLYGSHSLARVQWTEEFQADYMAEAARCVLANPRFCGLALWQFVDSRSYGPYGQVRTKPNGINLAGLLDEFRRRKLAFAAVRAVFAEFGKGQEGAADDVAKP